MSWQGFSTDRVDHGWGGPSDQRFAPTNRDRKKWKPFQQGRDNRGLRNAPKAPRAMSGTQRQQQAPQLELQMQLSLPRLAEKPLPTANVPRPEPLPPDHPLKREMDELKATRKKRQLYWAGLIEDLGDDEWGNPANYDRQTWENEERLADKKFEELAGQIKLAEMGFPLEAGEGQDQSGNTSAAWRSDQANIADAYHDRYSPDRRRTIRMQHHERQLKSPSQHRGRERPDNSFRGKNPNAPPRKEIFWTQRKRASAVNKWMDQMGMNTLRRASAMEPKNMVGGADASGGHVAVDDKDAEQNDYFNDLRAIDSPSDYHEGANHHEITDRPTWTILDELSFEEAEREREEERLLLGQYREEDRKARHTIETDAASVLTPSHTMTLANRSERERPRKHRSPSVMEPDLMSALMKTLMKGQVKSPNSVKASSRKLNANSKIPDRTLGLVPDNHASNGTSLQRQSSPQPSSTDSSHQMTNGISKKSNTEMASSAVPKPQSPPETETTRDGHTRANVAVNLMADEDAQIEKLDMRNDISSDGSETGLDPEPYSDCNDEDGFIHIDDAPPPSSPISIDNATSTKPPANSSQNNTKPNFSALGLHYRNVLKVNEMFSPAGTLLPPESGSAAARLRDLRRPYDEYSSLIRRWTAARRDEEDYEGSIMVEGVSDWVNPRIWLVDWRESLDMQG